MGTAYVSFGGNVGDVADTFDQASELITQGYGEVVRLSSLYSTPAIGENAGDAFLNAVAEIQTFLTPDQLLEGLHQIESQLGRERGVHWGPRTLDLDLLLYDELIIKSETLTLPHPRCWYRKFVLDGLAEIAGKLVHPVKGVPISQLKRQITRRPFEVGITSANTEIGQALIEYVNENFMDADAVAWQPGDDQPNLIIWHDDSQMALNELPLIARLDLTIESGLAQDALRDVLASAGLVPEPA